jgi:ribosomal protein S20
MKPKITNDLKKIIEREERKFKNDDTMNSFKEASKEFDKLVEEGIVKRRGYNLITIEEKHLRQYSINSY